MRAKSFEHRAAPDVRYLPRLSTETAITIDVRRFSRMTGVGIGFWKRSGEVCLKTGWQVHALGLMGNHFHLVVETP